MDKKPTFSFPATSGATGSSMFGSQTPAGGSPFGTAASNTSSAAASKPLFGTAGSTSGGLFSGASASGSTGFTFGKKPDDTSAGGAQKTPTTSPFTLGSSGTLGGSSSGGFSGGASTTPAAQPSKLFPFGGAGSTTPSATPPTASGSVENSGQQQTARARPMFGAVTSTGQASGTGIFSKPATSSGLSFGTTSAGGNLFQKNNPAPAASPAPASSAPAFSLTTPSQSSAPTASTGSAPSMATPGSGNSPASNLFGPGTKPTNTNTSAAPMATPSITPASAPSVNLFSQVPKAPVTQTPSTAAITSTPAATSGGSGFNLFAKPGASSSTSAATPASTSGSTGPNLFANLASTSAGPAATPASVSTSGSTGPNLFANLASSSAGPAAASSTSTAASAAPATTNAPTNNLGTTNPALGSSTTGTAPPASSRLKNKTMDEILTRWATDLSKHQKEFQKQAKQVAEWDRTLVENTDKIGKLLNKTWQAERDAAEVERQLSTVESQQNDIESWLDKYEKDVEDLSNKFGGNESSGHDLEREHTYKLAEKLTDRLDGLNKDLAEVIDEINGVSALLSNSSGPDDPLSNVVRVLNSHLQQLQKIDMDASTLQAKVKEAQKQASGLGTNGWQIGSDPSEDFMKSFRRR